MRYNHKFCFFWKFIVLWSVQTVLKIDFVVSFYYTYLVTLLVARNYFYWCKWKFLILNVCMIPCLRTGWLAYWLADLLAGWLTDGVLIHIRKVAAWIKEGSLRSIFFKEFLFCSTSLYSYFQHFSFVLSILCWNIPAIIFPKIFQKVTNEMFLK